MTSVVSDFKQSHGYFLVIGTVGVTYDIAAGSGAGGSFTAGAVTVNGATLSAGQILRDIGKTVLVGGIANTAGAVSSAGTVGVPTRVFRKVQLINATARVLDTAAVPAANIANGVGGSTATTGVLANYQTFYIELPTLGRSGGPADNKLGGLFTYVNSLPGLYV